MAAVGAFFGAVFFGTAATVSLGYAIAVQVARMVILQAISRALTKKPNLAQAAADKLLTVKNSIQPQAFVYGQDMLSGPLDFGQVTGKGNKYLHRLINLTGREIDSYVAFRFEDTDIVIGTDIPDANDTVSAGKYKDVVIVQTQLGTSTQTALSQLTTDCSANWTSAHRCRGWSQLYTRMEIKGKNDAFKRGAPQNLRALVKGCKIYDPRLDSTRVIDSSASPSTYGSGSHRADDSSTWEWSNNPALCLADWLMWGNSNDPDHPVGMSEEPERIDWELVAAAADICEEQVVIPPAGSPSTYQNRYTCNFTFYANDERGSIKQILEQAMLGRCVFSQGKWRMYAGAARTSTVTLDESYLAGAVGITAATKAGERYNRVQGKFVDPDRDYSANAFPEQTNSSYETDDGGVYYKTVDFNACNNSYEAQRGAIILLKQSRNQRTLRFEGNWKCFQIQVGDVCELDLDEMGFSGDKYFVTAWELRDAEPFGVTLTLQQETDSAWNDPAVGDYTTRSPTGELVPPSEPEGGLSDATIANEREGATCYAGVRLGADGVIYYQRADGSYSSAGAPPNEWLNSGSGSYYARCTILDSPQGALDDGTVDTWQALTTDRNYSINQASLGAKTKQIFLEISDASDGSNVILDATFDLSATYTEAVAYLAGGTENQVTVSGLQFGLRLVNDGTLRFQNSEVSPRFVYPSGQWYVNGPAGAIGSNYEALITENSHSGDSGNVYGGLNIGGSDTATGLDGNWRSITTSFEISFGRFTGEGAGTSHCNFTVQIRDASTQAVVASGTYDWTVTI